MTRIASGETDSQDTERPLRILFVVPNALPAIISVAGQNAGGMETRAWLLARSLAKHSSWDVTFVVRSDQRVSERVRRQIEAQTRVRVVVVWEPWRLIRQRVSRAWHARGGLHEVLLSPRWLAEVLLLAATWPFRRRDLQTLSQDDRLPSEAFDQWVVFGASRDSANAITTARARSEPIALCLASNDDVAPVGSNSNEKDASSSSNRYGDTDDERVYCVRNADVIVSQTAYQAGLVASRFQRESVVMKNPIDQAEWREDQGADGEIVGQGVGDGTLGVTLHGPVLWVGRMERVTKRFDVACEIARRCHDLPFLLIANPENDPKAESLAESLPANATLKRFQDATQMRQHFAQSSCLLVTSRAEGEGFPNVLLQMAAAGKPVVSLEDFGRFIEESKCGWHTDGDIDEAVSILYAVMHDGRRQPASPQDLSRYLHENHSPAAAAQRLAQVIRTCQR